MTNIISIQNAFAVAEEKRFEWPDPLPLPVSLLPVPSLQRELLPSELGPWLEDIAERLNIPMDFVGIPAMIAAGSLVGARLGVRPQAHTDWTETGNLWGCIVGGPGALKSPAVMEVLSPLRRMDVRADNAYQNELAFFEDKAAVYKLAKENAEKRARKAVQDGDLAAAERILSEAVEPNSPKAKRFLITDATVEKLGEICADNPDGILVYRDELITLMTDLECEERAAARGFFMSGWSGKDFYSFDRIGRGTIRIPRVNLSLLGTTQPGRLANYLRVSLSGKNDGMVQRLQLLSWPDASPHWEDHDRHPNTSAREAAFTCFDRLSKITAADVGANRDAFDDGTGIPFLRFDPDALDQFLQYRCGLEATIRSGEITEALEGHLSKYRGLIPRLALICHVASGGYGPVSGQAMEMALEWSKYLEAHARRSYGSLSIDNGEAAKAIWRRIEKGELSDGFTERDIYRRGWSNLPKGPRLSEGLKLLVECDWLMPRNVSTGIRASIAYFVNPKARLRPLLLAA